MLHMTDDAPAFGPYLLGAATQSLTRFFERDNSKDRSVGYDTHYHTESIHSYNNRTDNNNSYDIFGVRTARSPRRGVTEYSNSIIVLLQ